MLDTRDPLNHALLGHLHPKTWICTVLGTLSLKRWVELLQKDKFWTQITGKVVLGLERGGGSTDPNDPPSDGPE